MCVRARCVFHAISRVSWLNLTIILVLLLPSSSSSFFHPLSPLIFLLLSLLPPSSPSFLLLLPSLPPPSPSSSSSFSPPLPPPLPLLLPCFTFPSAPPLNFAPYLLSYPHRQHQVVDCPGADQHPSLPLPGKHQLCHLPGCWECRQDHCHSSEELPNSLVQRLARSVAVHPLLPGKLAGTVPTDLISADY